MPERKRTPQTTVIRLDHQIGQWKLGVVYCARFVGFVTRVSFLCFRMSRRKLDNSADDSPKSVKRAKGANGADIEVPTGVVEA